MGRSATVVRQTLAHLPNGEVRWVPAGTAVTPAGEPVDWWVKVRVGDGVMDGPAVLVKAADLADEQ